MAHNSGTKKQILVLLDIEKAEQLRKLNENTRVPKSVYLREAVDDLLKKYKREIAK